MKIKKFPKKKIFVGTTLFNFLFWRDTNNNIILDNHFSKNKNNITLEEELLWIQNFFGKNNIRKLSTSSLLINNSLHQKVRKLENRKDQKSFKKSKISMFSIKNQKLENIKNHIDFNFSNFFPYKKSFMQYWVWPFAGLAGYFYLTKQYLIYFPPSISNVYPENLKIKNRREFTGNKKIENSNFKKFEFLKDEKIHQVFNQEFEKEEFNNLWQFYFFSKKRQIQHFLYFNQFKNPDAVKNQIVDSINLEIPNPKLILFSKNHFYSLLKNHLYQRSTIFFNFYSLPYQTISSKNSYSKFHINNIFDGKMQNLTNVDFLKQDGKDLILKKTKIKIKNSQQDKLFKSYENNELVDVDSFFPISSYNKASKIIDNQFIFNIFSDMSDSFSLFFNLNFIDLKNIFKTSLIRQDSFTKKNINSYTLVSADDQIRSHSYLNIYSKYLLNSDSFGFIRSHSDSFVFIRSHRCSDAQMLRCSDGQMLSRSDAQMLKNSQKLDQSNFLQVIKQIFRNKSHFNNFQGVSAEKSTFNQKYLRRDISDISSFYTLSSDINKVINNNFKKKILIQHFIDSIKTDKYKNKNKGKGQKVVSSNHYFSSIHQKNSDLKKEFKLLINWFHLYKLCFKDILVPLTKTNNKKTIVDFYILFKNRENIEKRFQEKNINLKSLLKFTNTKLNNDFKSLLILKSLKTVHFNSSLLNINIDKNNSNNFNLDENKSNINTKALNMTKRNLFEFLFKKKFFDKSLPNSQQCLILKLNQPIFFHFNTNILFAYKVPFKKYFDLLEQKIKIKNQEFYLNMKNNNIYPDAESFNFHLQKFNEKIKLSFYLTRDSILFSKNIDQLKTSPNVSKSFKSFSSHQKNMLLKNKEKNNIDNILKISNLNQYSAIFSKNPDNKSLSLLLNKLHHFQSKISEFFLKLFILMKQNIRYLVDQHLKIEQTLYNNFLFSPILSHTNLKNPINFHNFQNKHKYFLKHKQKFFKTKFLISKTRENRKQEKIFRTYLSYKSKFVEQKKLKLKENQTTNFLNTYFTKNRLKEKNNIENIYEFSKINSSRSKYLYKTFKNLKNHLNKKPSFLLLPKNVEYLTINNLNKENKSISERSKDSKQIFFSKTPSNNLSFSSNTLLRRIGFLFFYHSEQLNLDTINRLDKEKSFQKKRRRKKRKRFYPRPVWSRFLLYKNFLMFRYFSFKKFLKQNTKFEKSEIKIEFNKNIRLKNSYTNQRRNCLKRKFTISKPLSADDQIRSRSSSDAQMLSSSDAQMPRYYLNKKNENQKNFSSLLFSIKAWNNLKFSTKIYRNNKQQWGYTFQNRKDMEKNLFQKTRLEIPSFNNHKYYKINTNLMSDFQRLCWKSYWLRSSLTPYIRRVQHSLKKMREVDTKWERFPLINKEIFDLKLVRSNIDCVSSNKIFNNNIQKKFFPKFFYLNMKNAFETNFSLNSSLIFNRFLERAEYDHKIYERIADVIQNVKVNLNNLNEKSNEKTLDSSFYPGYSLKQLYPKSFKRGRRKQEKVVHQSFWSRFALNLNRTLNLSEIHTNSFRFDNSIRFDNLPTLRSLWALNQTNILSLKADPKKNTILNETKSLWATLKFRDQNISNKTNKFFYTKIQNKLFPKNLDKLSFTKLILFNKKLRYAGFCLNNQKMNIRYLKFKFKSVQNNNRSKISTNINKKILKQKNDFIFEKNNQVKQLNLLETSESQKHPKRTIHFWWSTKSKNDIFIFKSFKNDLFPTSSISSFFTFLWGCTLLFHISTLFSLIQIDEIRSFMKFFILFLYKFSNSYIIVIYSIFTLIKNYLKQFSFLFKYIRSEFLNSLFINKNQNTVKNTVNEIFINSFLFKQSISFYNQNNYKVIYSKNQNLEIQKITKQNVDFINLMDFIKESDRTNILSKFFSEILLKKTTIETKTYSNKKIFMKYYFNKKNILDLKKDLNKNKNIFLEMYFYLPNLKRFLGNDRKVPTKNTNNIIENEKYITNSLLQFNKKIIQLFSSPKNLNLSFYSVLYFILNKDSSKKDKDFNILLFSQNNFSKNSYEKQNLIFNKKILFFNIISKIQNLFWLFVFSMTKASIKIMHECASICSLIVFKIIDFFESLMLIIYKFLEKPAEFMIDWIAQFFLIEWSSELTSFIPESFDIYTWQSFTKLYRGSRIFGLFGFFIQRRLWCFFEIFVNEFTKPDSDLKSRQKKGLIFWDIWAEILMIAAEKYQINLSSLMTLKEEQEAFLERLLDDPKFNSTFSINLKSNESRLFIKSIKNQTKDSFIKKSIEEKQAEALNDLARLATMTERPFNFHKNLLFVKSKINLRNFNIDNIYNNNKVLLIKKNFDVNNKNSRNKQINRWSANQYFSHQGIDTDLFIDVHPPKSFCQLNILKSEKYFFKFSLSKNQSLSKSIRNDSYSFVSADDQIRSHSDSFVVIRSHSYSQMLRCSDAQLLSSSDAQMLSSSDAQMLSSSFNKNDFSDQVKGEETNIITAPLIDRSGLHTLGSLTCQIYSGLLKTQVSKNILVVGAPGNRQNLLIYALAGETELKMITDNAHRYAQTKNGVAVGMKLLRDVFDGLALHTPCLFLMEDIHVIGERRPMLLSDHENFKIKESAFKNNNEEVHEKNQLIYQLNKHIISDFKKPYKGDFSLLLPTNHFCFDLFLGVSAPKIRKMNVSPRSPLNIESRFYEQKTSLNESIKHQNQPSNLIFASQFQFPSKKYLAPPATSPFTILNLKEQRKFKAKTLIKELPWGGMSSDQMMLIPKVLYSIRVKIAFLADLAMNQLGVKLDMITDLLVIMDNVRSNRGFVVFATTHLPFVLDPALRRPGRFDETISLSILQSINNRIEILKTRLENYSSTFEFFDYSFLIQHLNETSLFNLINRTKLLLLNNSNQNLFLPINNFNREYKNKDLKEFLIKTKNRDQQLNNNFLFKEIISINQGMKFLTQIEIIEPEKIYKKSNINTKIIDQNNFSLLTLLKTDHLIASQTKSILALTYSQVGTFMIQSKNLDNRCFRFVYSSESANFLSTNFEKYLPIKIFNNLYSPSFDLQNHLMHLISGKIGEFFVFNNSYLLRKQNFASFIQPSTFLLSFREKNETERKETKNLQKFRTTELLSALTSPGLESGSWNFSIFKQSQNSSYHENYQNNNSFDILLSAATSFVFSFVQKRYLFHKNLMAMKLLYFHDNKELYEPPSPPASSILMPSRKYENLKRTERDFQQKSVYSILEKIQIHQKQRSMKHLYEQPVFELFRSEMVENRYTRFSSSVKELGYYDSKLRKTTSVNCYYKNRILTRQQFYLVNQWWSGQLAEHNLEKTFSSDVDWRSMFVESFGDLVIDFPDAEQYYNPKLRRWFLQSTYGGYWQTFEKTIPYEIYYHFMILCFNKAFNYLNTEREILDDFAYTYLQKGFLKEIDFISNLSKFYISSI